MSEHTDHALEMTEVLDRICLHLDAEQLCAAQGTCQTWLKRMGPSLARWEEQCGSTWSSAFWWPWRHSVFASVGNWQKVWFTLLADIRPSSEEMERIFSIHGRDWAFILDELPEGWWLVVITTHCELAALPEPVAFIGGKQKYGELRISLNLPSSEETRQIVKTAKDRCSGICEVCGIDGCNWRDIWGYMCVRCKPCRLSWFGARLQREQNKDGYFSVEGNSWDTFATRKALTLVKTVDGASPPVAVAGTCIDPVEQHRTTFAVCCFLDQLILQFMETDVICSGHRQAVAMRAAAQAFLDQAEPSVRATATAFKFTGARSFWDTIYAAS